MKLVAIDADVLGRRRTGDETYVLNLLRALAPLAPESGLRFAAITRHPELVPAGIEPVKLSTSSQELRMAVMLPRLLRRLGADLGHFQYALPLRLPCPAVVTIHDLSFERDPSLMGRKDRLVFKTMVPRAARQAARVLTVSERTRRDLIEVYELADERIVVTPNGVDPAFSPGAGARDYALLVGAVQERKNPLAALAAAEHAGLPLVVAGPAKDEDLTRELRTPRRARDRLRAAGRARRALPRRRLPAPDLALRGLRPAGARGDGLRDARRRGRRACAPGGRRRRGDLRGRGRARRRDPAGTRRARRAERRGGRSRTPLLLGGHGSEDARGLPEVLR